jgi:hypothetical protein
MTAQVLKEKGLMETILLIEKDTISMAAVLIGTEQIPHWKTDDSVCGYARSLNNVAKRSVAKEVKGHQRPC